MYLLGGTRRKREDVANDTWQVTAQRQSQENRREGVYFIATGDLYVKAALRALESIRANNPQPGIALATDVVDDPALKVFDVVVPVENPHVRSKVDLLSKTPFDKTIYLDTDINVVAYLSGVMFLLDRFDIALCHTHSRAKKAMTESWRMELPDAFPQLNGGIIVYRKTPDTM